MAKAALTSSPSMQRNKMVRPEDVCLHCVYTFMIPGSREDIFIYQKIIKLVSQKNTENSIDSKSLEVEEKKI